jgi:hypothetical protein
MVAGTGRIASSSQVPQFLCVGVRNRLISYGTYWLTNFSVCPVVNMGVSYTNYSPHTEWKTSSFLPAVRAKAKQAGYDSDDYDLDLVHMWVPVARPQRWSPWPAAGAPS